MSKYYAVVKGIAPGIYDSWKDCEAQVKGFPGASYKGFPSKKDAEAFYEEHQLNSAESKTKVSSAKDDNYDKIIDEAYRSLNFLHDNKFMSDKDYERYQETIKVQSEAKQSQSKIYKTSSQSATYEKGHVNICVDGSYNPDNGEFGYGVYIDDGSRKQILAGHGTCEYNGRNVEGEVMGATKGLEYVSMFPQYKSATVYFDYQGVAKWADHEWKANLAYTKQYAEFVDKIRANGLDVKFVWTEAHTGIEGNEVVDKLAKMGCGVELNGADAKFIGKYANVPGYEQAVHAMDDFVEQLEFDNNL